MKVQISIRHMLVSLVDKQMVYELCDELHNNFDEILNIDVKIDDINGPNKSGIDKRCHLKVRGKEHLVIDIDEVDENLDCAIDTAFQRLKKDMKHNRALQEKYLSEQVVIM